MRNIYSTAALRSMTAFIIILFSYPAALKSQQLMRANLFVVDNNGSTLVDGNLTNYDNIYSNNVDMNDAWKMTNPGINFGILREGNNLVVERRALIENADTTFFRMWNLPQRNYRIKFILKNLDHSGLVAIVKDKYLNRETYIALNDTTYYDFAVNGDAASANQLRFELVYTNAFSSPVPVSFTGIQAQRTGRFVLVKWNVANEESMLSYTVEHSADGIKFSNLHQLYLLNAGQSKNYYYTDKAALTGNNFYRIKGTSISGRVQYSAVAKINALTTDASVTVYPNPVQNKKLQLSLNNVPSGNYNIALINENGARQQVGSINLTAIQSNQSINLPQSISAGIYILELVGPGNQRTIQSIQVL